MNEGKLTHISEDGNPQMVDISGKEVIRRTAKAGGEVILKPETISLLKNGVSKKGDVISTAKIAGIMAAKKTYDLIPLCHDLLLESVELDIQIDDEIPGLSLQCTVVTNSKTGAEMEALTAITIAALTIYDMLKAIEKTIRISNIRLIEKHGGRSGSVINE